MAKSPDARFPSASAMRAALEAALRAPSRRRERIRRLASAGVTCGAMVVAAIASAQWARRHQGVIAPEAAVAPAAKPVAAAPPTPAAAALPTPPPTATLFATPPVPSLPALREGHAALDLEPPVQLKKELARR
jgi:hypothetical protein